MGLKAGACYGLAIFFCPCHFPLILLVLFAAAGATGWMAGKLALAFMLSLVLSGGFLLAGFLLGHREWKKELDKLKSTACNRTSSPRRT